MFWLGLLIVIAVVEGFLLVVGACYAGDLLDGIGFVIFANAFILVAALALAGFVFGLSLMGVL